MIRPTTMMVVLLSTALASPVAARERPNCDEVRGKVQAQLEAACPCATAATHSEYVRCVNDKVRGLSACQKSSEGKQTCGNVPRACVWSLRRTASRSSCGSPKAVTCCVPRQEDCTGDPASGDGKKEGTCSRSKRRCDAMSDCLIPRCQSAADAERCSEIGGTLGKGPDCSTACAP